MEPVNSVITVRTVVYAPIQKVWTFWTDPEHIMQWNNASDDWHTTHATNDLRVSGNFLSHMAAKDGSFSFDFEGTYSNVELHRTIEYTIADGRDVKINFMAEDTATVVVESFEAESTHSIEMQRTGWQSILDNFKKYVEST